MSGVSIDQRYRWVGASEIAALLGVSRFETRDHLKQLKMQKVESADLSASEAVQRGHRLEPEVLSRANAYFSSVEVTPKLSEYVPSAKVKGMGSSPDAFATWTRPDGIVEFGVVEAKTTKQAFWFPKDGQCPLSWQLQIQAQLACCNSYVDQPPRTFGILAVLIDETEFRTFFIKQDPAMAMLVEEAVKRFWAEIEAELKADRAAAREAAKLAKEAKSCWAS